MPSKSIFAIFFLFLLSPWGILDNRTPLTISTNVPYGVPNIDGELSDLEWDMMLALNLRLDFSDSTSNPPYPLSDAFTSYLGIQYDHNAIYMALRIQNITIVGDGYTLNLKISIDDNYQKDWLPQRYARGDVHTYHLYSSSYSRCYDNFFVGNTTTGYSYRLHNIIDLLDTNEDFAYTTEGPPVTLGNFTLETTFQYHEVSGRITDCNRVQFYRLQVVIGQHYYWNVSDDTWDYHDSRYVWPPDSTHLMQDEYYPESVFNNWSTLECPDFAPPFTPPFELIIGIMAVVVIITLSILVYWRHRSKISFSNSREQTALISF